MICRSTLEEIKEGCYSKKAAKELFGSHKSIDSLIFTRSDFFTEGPRYATGMSLSGVQQKLSLLINDRDQFEMTVTGGRYILKPSPEAFPCAAENEQCAMALSRSLGIPTAASAVIPFADGELAYITRRYDRAGDTKLQQEDLAQGFSLSSREKYGKSYEEALEMVHAMSGGKLSVVRDLFNRIVFAYLIGNDDMHLKNISLIRYEGNRTPYYDGLTPNYDQLFASSFENSSKIGFLALDLFKEESEGKYSILYQRYGFYTGGDFLLLGERAGLPQAAIRTVFRNYYQKQAQMEELILRSFMPSDMKEKAVSVIRDRLKALAVEK